MNGILQFLQSVVSLDQAQVLAYMILANLVLGTVAALKDGKFELAKFWDFGKRTLIVFGTYLGVSVASKAIADFTELRNIAWGALVAYMGTQVISNVTDLLGTKVPEGVQKWLQKWLEKV